MILGLGGGAVVGLPLERILRKGLSPSSDWLYFDNISERLQPHFTPLWS
jgi:hypothetical protein